MPGSGFSDIDLKHWKDYLPDIETGSLWLFSSRDNAGPHKGDYHGNFIPQIPHQLLLRYTKAGDVVLDMFAGSGTTLIEAKRLGRHAIGVELLPGVAELAAGRVAEAEGPVGTVQRLVVGNSAAAETAEAVGAELKGLGREQCQLLILHPPYSDIIAFSDGTEPEDLSNVESDEEFLERFSAVVANAKGLLEPGRFMGLVIGDCYRKGQLVPLGFRCMQLCLDEGFELKSIVVKNIEGNEKGKGKDENLWKYRALAGGFYIFKHEYVMVFRSPKPAK